MIAMNPITTSIMMDHYNRVPPICVNKHTTPILVPNNQYSFLSVHNPTLTCEQKYVPQSKPNSKRGRKSTIPPELRDQTRRVSTARLFDRS